MATGVTKRITGAPTASITKRIATQDAAVGSIGSDTWGGTWGGFGGTLGRTWGATWSSAVAGADRKPALNVTKRITQTVS